MKKNILFKMTENLKSKIIFLFNIKNKITSSNFLIFLE